MAAAVLKEADMRNRLGLTTVTGACKLLAGVALVVASTIAAQAQSPTLEQLLSGVVHIKTWISAGRGDLHRAAAPDLERRGAHQSRWQAGRRRLSECQ